jgi:hypothetical protein
MDKDVRALAGVISKLTDTIIRIEIEQKQAMAQALQRIKILESINDFSIDKELQEDDFNL